MKTNRGLFFLVLLFSLCLVWPAGAISLKTDLTGEARSSKKSKTWAFRMQIKTHDRASGAIVGEMEWKSLKAIHRIEGTLKGSRLEFTETGYIKKGKANLNVSYRLKARGDTWEGDWTDPVGDNGTVTLVAGGGEEDSGAGVMFPQEVVLEGEAKSSKGKGTWVFTILFSSVSPNGDVTGEISWPSLSARHRIVGTLKGDILEFTETAHIKKGKAHLNVSYRLSPSSGLWVGTWTDPKGDEGTVSFGGN